MESDLNKSIRRLPSVAIFAERLSEDLSNNRSVIVMLPLGVDIEWVLPLVRSLLYSESIFFQEYHIEDWPEDIACTQQVAMTIGVVGDNGLPPWSVRSFVKASTLPAVVILILDSQMKSSNITELYKFVAEWAMFAHQEANRGRRPTAFLLVASGREIHSEIPETDLYLAVRFWWGIPSLTETRVLSMQHLSGGNNMLWEEYVLSSIASGELPLLARLLNERENGETIQEIITAHYKSAVWTEDELTYARNMLRSEFKSRVFTYETPPIALLKPWAAGILSYTPERGVTMSAAALAMLGVNDETNHRFWTGQAELLMPMIDSFRLKLCDHLTERFGKNWPTNWVMPDSEEELIAVKTNPRACQWGHISAIFNSSEKLRKMNGLHNTVKCLRYIRNELAHFRPITEGEYRRLHALMERAF